MVQNERGREQADEQWTPATFHETERMAQRAQPRAWRSGWRAMEDFSRLWNFIKELWLVFSRLDSQTASGL